MESSVVVIILTCCINKQQMAKWVNIKKGSRAFKPDILIQVLWLLVTSEVGRSFLELIGAHEPELLLFKFVILCRGFREGPCC